MPPLDPLPLGLLTLFVTGLANAARLVEAVAKLVHAVRKKA